MRIGVAAGLLVLLYSIFLLPSSAMTLSEGRVGTTLTASGLPPGATVQFVLNNGLPVFAMAETDGTARYLPLLQGQLDVVAMQDGAVVDSARTTVLAAAVVPLPPPSGGGDGGGTGGGGVTSSEPLENIEKAETQIKNLVAGTQVTYGFIAPELGVYEIIVTGKKTENLVSLRVEALKGTSKIVAASPAGAVIKNVNIWAGTELIESASIRFKVGNSELEENDLEPGDIKMVRWDGSKWIDLETSEKIRDGTYTYFEANTTAFSPFAVVGVKVPERPVVEGPPAVTTPPPAGPPATPVEEAGGFGIILAVAAFSMYVLRKKRR